MAWQHIGQFPVAAAAAAAEEVEEEEEKEEEEVAAAGLGNPEGVRPAME